MQGAPTTTAIGAQRLPIGELPVKSKSHFRKLQSLQTAPLRTFTPGLSASFPTSKNPHKNHAFTTNCPHISCWKKHNSRASPPKIPEQNQTRSPKSVKLTTTHHKNRRPFYPQEGGQSSTLDIFVSPEAHFDRPRFRSMKSSQIT